MVHRVHGRSRPFRSDDCCELRHYFKELIMIARLVYVHRDITTHATMIGPINKILYSVF